MINHGLSTGALFLMVGMIYERRHTRLIADFGGLWKVIPAFSALFLVVSLSSLGLPGLNGFVGEFLVLVGAFQVNPWLAALATTGIIFAAVYLLWMYQRVIFGEVTHEENRRLDRPLAARVGGAAAGAGVHRVDRRLPAAFTGKTEATIAALIAQVAEQGQRGAACDDAATIVRARASPSAALLPALIVLGAAALVLLLDLLPPRDSQDAPGRRRAGRHRRPRCWRRVRAVGDRGARLPRHGPARQLRALLRPGDLLRGRAGRACSRWTICGRTGGESGEYYSLVLFATAGMMLMASAGDLIVVFLVARADVALALRAGRPLQDAAGLGRGVA